VSEESASARRWRRVGLVVALLVTLVLVGVVVYVLSSPGEVKKKRAVQEITLLKPPPPPPPPKEQPPPPPKEQVQEKIDVPKPDQPAEKPADAPPPGPDLGVDANGTGSGDSFGLVGKKGGGDLIGGGGGGGISGSKFAWYGGLVKDRIQDAVSKVKKLREADYRVMVNVWIGPGGAVTRAELVDSTGNADLDNELRNVLRNLPPLREGAPSDMPQPMKLRITAR
jgi:protein TonB